MSTGLTGWELALWLEETGQNPGQTHDHPQVAGYLPNHARRQVNTNIWVTGCYNATDWKILNDRTLCLGNVLTKSQTRTLLNAVWCTVTMAAQARQNYVLMIECRPHSNKNKYSFPPTCYRLSSRKMVWKWPLYVWERPFTVYEWYSSVGLDADRFVIGVCTCDWGFTRMRDKNIGFNLMWPH